MLFKEIYPLVLIALCARSSSIRDLFFCNPSSTKILIRSSYITLPGRESFNRNSLLAIPVARLKA